jgi:acyl dehydratase
VAIDYETLSKAQIIGKRFKYTQRDAMLYALSVGYGRDPLNEEELRFVYEKTLKAVPTMATIMTDDAIVADAGLNQLMVVHAEERLTLHKPLPAAAEVVVDSRINGIYDKGKDKGAIVVIETTVKDGATGTHFSTVNASIFARGDGGFGGPTQGAPEGHRLPTRAPDLVVDCDTRPDQALLYALSGDYNPLHRDPEIAKMAGYPAPILHGLCTYGTAYRAIVSKVCNYQVERVTGFDVRFSAPGFPGDTIATEIWVDGNIVSFRSTAKERGVVVLSNGKCTLSS